MWQFVALQQVLTHRRLSAFLQDLGRAGSKQYSSKSGQVESSNISVAYTLGCNIFVLRVQKNITPASLNVSSIWQTVASDGPVHKLLLDPFVTGLTVQTSMVHLPLKKYFYSHWVRSSFGSFPISGVLRGKRLVVDTNVARDLKRSLWYQRWTLPPPPQPQFSLCSMETTQLPPLPLDAQAGCFKLFK